MIAQAEHIPVHLGAMPDAVAAVMRHDPAPDDVFVLNDPYAGGTHLPDITLVSRTEVGFAVTRAHHADVGGSEPGSMPAGSRTLADEGVVIPPTRLDDDVLARPHRADAQPRRAARRFPGAARRAPARRAASRRALRASRAGPDRRRHGPSCTPTPSASCARRSRVCPTAASRRGRARGARRRPRPARRGHHRGRRDRVRLRGHRAPARRQPQLPALGHALGLLLRRPLPDRARPPLLGRRLRARDRQRARPARSSTRSRRPPSPPGTSRPPAGSSTASSPRSARRSRSRRRARGR